MKSRLISVGTSVAVLSFAALGFAASPASAVVTPPTSCSATPLFTGAGSTGADDVAILGSNIFVGYQNGVNSDGVPTAAAPNTSSTLYELTSTGAVVNHWTITGKIDGLGADVAGGRVIGTVNEDGNSALFTVAASTGTLTHYTYSAALPHGGGTDAVSVFNGHIYVSASANMVATGVPAVYAVTLSGTIATATDTAMHVDSSATVINAPGGSTTLALSDADSNTVVPSFISGVGGSFMLTSQGDGQVIFAQNMAPGSAIKVLNLTPGIPGANATTSIDDTAFPTQASGELISTSGATVSAITCTSFAQGQAFSSVTPCNANGQPSTCTLPNYLASLDLTTGALTPMLVNGAQFKTKGLAFLPITVAVPPPSAPAKPSASVASVVGPRVNTGASTSASGSELPVAGLTVTGSALLGLGLAALRRRRSNAAE